MSLEATLLWDLLIHSWLQTWPSSTLILVLSWRLMPAQQSTRWSVFSLSLIKYISLCIILELRFWTLSTFPSLFLLGLHTNQLLIINSCNLNKSSGTRLCLYYRSSGFSADSPALYCHCDVGIDLAWVPVVVSKRSSYWQWYCGETRPVCRLRISETFRACLDEYPRFIPTLVLSDHFLIFLWSCSSFSTFILKSNCTRVSPL